MELAIDETNSVKFEPSNAHVESLTNSCTDEAVLTFPDGGRKAWLTVLGSWLSFINSIGFLSSFSIFQSYYSSVLLPTRSPSDVSWIGSVQIWGCLFFGAFSGRLLDAYGPRLPIALGGFFIVLGTMMASISTQYYQLLLSQGFCSALGFGLSFTPALAVPSQWFLKRRGIAVALVMSGQNVGGVIWPVIVNKLINYDGISFGWTMRIVGFVQLVLMSLSTLLVQSRFSRMPPESTFVLSFFKDKPTLLLTFATFIMFWGIFVPYFFITPYGMQYGASASAAFYYPSILNAAAVVGCCFIGFAADQVVGYFNAITFAAIACTATAFGWMGVHTIPAIIVWTVAYGFLSGAFQALFSPCISHLAPEPGLIGTWNGLAIAIVSFPTLGAGPVTGKLLDNAGGGNYMPMQLFTGASLAAASILFLGTRLIVSRKMRI